MNKVFEIFKNIRRGNKSIIAEEEKLEIGFLVFWVGTKCTLRCRDCGNLIPYGKQVSYDMDVIIQDLKTILTFCKVTKMQIQGGEPFTHKDIKKLIEVIDDLNIDEVVITTNGTVNLNHDIISSLKKVKNPKFQIVISFYECAEDKQNEFYNVLVNTKIRCLKYSFAYGDGTWINQGSIDVCRNNNDAAVQKLYSECDFKVCLSLVDGRLFRCGRAKISYEVFNLDYKENDYLDIRNLSSKKQGLFKITEFLNDPNFKEYCRYCLGTEEKIPAGIQLSKGEKKKGS